MRGRPMRGKELVHLDRYWMPVYCGGMLTTGIVYFAEEGLTVRAPITRTSFRIPENYVLVYEETGPALTLCGDSGERTLTSEDVGVPNRLGTWRIYRGGPRGLWITFEDKTEEGI